MKTGVRLVGRCALAGATFAAGMAAVATTAHAGGRAEFVVNTRGDTVDAMIGDDVCADANGKCSLRAAMQEAATNSGQVTVTLAGGTYILALPGTGEDASATGDLDVSGKLYLRGRGATIDGQDMDRLIDVLPGGSVYLENVSLNRGAAPDGESGGAIRNQGTLTTLGGTIANSAAEGVGGSGGGVFNDGGVYTATRTIFSRNRANRAGGAIESNAGTTILDEVEMRANSAGAAPGNGGALHLTGAGYVEVRDSNIVDNTAAAEGGGLWNSGGGDMRIFDSRIAGNTAAGTDADQGGGGLFNDGGQMRVIRTRVEYNAAGVGSGSGGGIFNNNGSMMVSGCFVRANSSNRAGGGIEANAGNTTVVSSRLVANATGASPGNGGGLHLTGAGIVNVQTSYVAGNVAASEGGGLWNSGGGTMTITSSGIRDNVAAGDGADNGGGGLFNDGGDMRVLTNSYVRSNVASGAAGSGGGIMSTGGSLIVRSAEITRNRSNRAGGAAEIIDGTAEFSAVDMRFNSTGDAPGNGGAIHVTGADAFVRVINSIAISNVAGREGGGFWNNGGTMRISGTIFRDNRANGPAADDGGGALFNNGGTLIVETSRIKANFATGAAGSGGGIFSNGGSLDVSNTVIDLNTANRAGGGIETLTGDADLFRVTLADNTAGDAPGNGGGFHITGAGTVTIAEGRVQRNSATNEGGGLWNHALSTMTVTDTRIANNNAPVGNNVFTQPGGTLTIDGVPQ